jgi:hypothetical protein
LTSAPTMRDHRRTPRWSPLAACVLLPLVGLGGCTPTGGSVEPRARGYWATEITKSPPVPDAAAVPPEDPDPTMPDPGPAGPAPTADASTPTTNEGGARPDERPPTTPGQDAGPPAPPPAPNEGTPSVAGPCMLKFDVTTTNAGGEYAPRNVGAIWVSDGTNKFVKTLKVWANRRQKHLNKWIAASGQDTTDAVTGATLSSHGARTAMWDCSGVNHQPVPFGEYRINIEFTEKNSAGPSTSVAFSRNGAAQMVSAPDQANFKGARIQVTP